MDSSKDDHTFSESCLQGIDETLQRELDTVQAVYFPPEVEQCSSSDSESESSDEDDRSNALFDPTILTLCNTANDTLNKDLCENPEPGDCSTEVSEELIHKFLSASCQCSLGPNERPCSSLFTEATVFELRSQCLELTSDQLDMLILAHRWAYQRKSGYETISFILLCQGSSSWPENIFVSSLHIQKETLEPEIALEK